MEEPEGGVVGPVKVLEKEGFAVEDEDGDVFSAVPTNNPHQLLCPHLREESRKKSEGEELTT